MVSNYDWAKKALETETHYVAACRKTIGDFPLIDCPHGYKEALCALSGGGNLLEYINSPLEALGGRAPLQVLNEGDYDKIERYIFECVTLDLVGPGAL